MLVAAKSRWKATGRKGRYRISWKLCLCRTAQLSRSEKPSHSRAKHTELKAESRSFMFRKLSYRPWKWTQD